MRVQVDEARRHDAPVGGNHAPSAGARQRRRERDDPIASDADIEPSTGATGPIDHRPADNHHIEGRRGLPPDRLRMAQTQGGNEKPAGQSADGHPEQRRLAHYRTATTSTSKTSVALGGMGPDPLGPYPSAEPITSFRLPPTRMPATP